MAKKDKKKGGAPYGDWEEEAEDVASQELGEAAESEESKPQEPVVASAGDDFEDGGLMGALKRTKKKKDDKKEADEKAAVETSGVTVKSKKEKEKEKKEREKARKKAQAERKKTAPKLEKATPDSSVAAEKSSGGDASSTKATSATKGKGSKKSAVVAALQKQLAAQKAAAEAQRLAEEEELAREEEIRKQIEEEERIKEEARQRKKEKERLKKEELRAQGKLLTKKQKEQQALLERRREQLLASGVVVEGLNGGAKKPVYGKKKASKKNNESDVKGSPKTTEPETKEPQVKEPQVKEPQVKEPQVAEAKESGSEDIEQPKKATSIEDESPAEEPLLDDWEAALDSDGEVKESWDDEDEDEDEQKEEKEQLKQKRVETLSEHKKPSTKSAASSTNTQDVSVLERGTTLSATRRQEVNEKREERIQKAKQSANASNLRSPICCILGHVDTGKTKLLDKVRQTNVQEGEAGGITQQIGATYFPIDSIEQKTKVMEKYVSPVYSVPGLLVIDTPGHESFTNLRSRGSSLCNIAILVVDIMHGLEPQTLESIRLLRDGKTPFVVALNKIDRLYDWEATPNNSFRDSLAKQKSSVEREFFDRLDKTKLAFSEQGLNAELYYQNKNLSKNVSLVPTSAITGEGVPDLLYLLLELTQTRMSKQLMYLSSLEATILEVKVIEGLGTTIDVVLSNGILREGDRIVLCGMNGPIATTVRALLTPQPLRELRVKSQYVHNKEVKAALGVKIAANDLEKAVAGSRLLVVGPEDDEEELMDDVMDDLTGLLDSVDKSGNGVSVQASTLGSLEALLDFLKDMKIPVMSISIGPVYRRDVMRAAAMLDKAKEYAVMLCFDVKIDKEAEQYAQEQGVKIFSADIIYHLFDSFTEYQQKLLEERKKENAAFAVYPCALKTIQVINKRNPMIIGVDILEGSLRIGTPIAIVKADPSTGQKMTYPLGRVVSLEVNHKPVETIRKGQTNAGVAMRLEAGSSSLPTWGRHIDETDTLYSQISRKSIDVLKDPAFRNDVPRDDWLLIKNLKPVFDIK